MTQFIITQRNTYLNNLPENPIKNLSLLLIDSLAMLSINSCNLLITACSSLKTENMISLFSDSWWNKKNKI